MMKILWLCVFVVMCHAWHKRKLSPLRNSVRTDNSFTCGPKPGLYCNDCDEIKFCQGGQMLGEPMKCAEMDPEKPNCNPITNECDKLSFCQGTATNFVCTRAGYFPDVTDCKKYILCTGPDEYGGSYSCMYDQYVHLKGCMGIGNCLDYISICGNKTHRMAYPGDKSIYVECKGENESPELHVCPENHSYNIMKKECEFVCPNVGMFPHTNPMFFYFCFRRGNEYVSFVMSCPKGQNFEPDKNACKPKPVTTIPTTIATTTKRTDETTTTPKGESTSSSGTSTPLVTGETRSTANVETQATTSQVSGETSSTAKVETNTTPSQVSGETSSTANVETNTTPSQVSSETSSTANVETNTTPSPVSGETSSTANVETNPTPSQVSGETSSTVK